jgi:hypothetical protein
MMEAAISRFGECALGGLGTSLTIQLVDLRGERRMAMAALAD